MDELQISGKRYISSRRIAKAHGYTSDYVGQLIRGGKILGQKVGRAWYVDEASFDAYLGKEAPAIMPTEEPVVESIVKVSIGKKEVEKPQPVVDTPVEPEVVEEPIEPIVIEKIVVEEKQQPPQPIRPVPLRVRTPAAAAVTTIAPTGLRYYADDVPALPEIRSSLKTSRQKSVYEAPEEIEESIAVFEEPVQKKRSRFFTASALALAGLLIFVCSAVLSSATVLNLSIEGGNAANAFYSVEW